MELNYPEFYDRFAAFLRSLEGRRVVVISHARPDGDCIGSQVALTRVLRALNIDAICANPDPVPRRIQFAVGDTPLINFSQLPEGDFTAIYVDCADQECEAEADCLLESGNCNDQLDNDNDNDVDCEDADCANDALCQEAGNCDDNNDNDLDGAQDCEDDDCINDAICIEAGNCDDQVENDLDGDEDCNDADCLGDPACP